MRNPLRVVVALRVIRREGTFFVEAHRVFVKRFKLLFADQKLEEPAANPNRNVFALPFVVLGGASSIRDNFQFDFLVCGGSGKNPSTAAQWEVGRGHLF